MSNTKNQKPNTKTKSSVSTQKAFKETFENTVQRYFSCQPSEATPEQMYKALALVVKDELTNKKVTFHKMRKEQHPKKVYYLCMEFLVGRSLKNNLYNLGLTNTAEKVLKGYGVNLADLYELEPDAGLGNGGLGRLAACFMDSLATLDYPATGFSIRYEYGLFKQKIVDGWQTELPDVWLPGGDVWLTERKDLAFRVKFDGRISENWTENGLSVDYTDYDEIEAVPYDMMISGADSTGVSTLRLWAARDIDKFDMKSFSSGDYVRSTIERTNAEMISKVLYPADNHFEGKSLRLKQQYFLVSASIQNIINDHLAAYGTLSNFADKVAIHINDTHPALCIPELMRIFVDDYHYDWDTAWDIVCNTVAYTNHTVLAEALEKWPEDLIERRLPRIHMIIKEINQRFCNSMWEKFPGEWEKIERMAVLSHSQVRMANLSVIGSHKVNGVSALHSDILTKTIFKDFADTTPEKFTNVTNGIAHRRWLCQSNPALTKLLDETIGDGYKKIGTELEKLRAFKDDKAILEQLEKIKKDNKIAFANRVNKTMGIAPDPDSLFDVQAKRLHEYKRQLLNAMRIISLYLELKDNPNKDIQPQTFFFAAKAAPGYYHAKRIIQLISELSALIEKDPAIREKIRVVFLENYCATMAEHLMPAADISQQISLAGKEASGTGNMKLMINGAITLGTMDGANVEIYQSVGKDNIYIFGMSDKEVDDLWKTGYNALWYYDNNEKIRRVIDFIRGGINGTDFSDIARYLMYGDHGIADPYMCLADFGDYCSVHDRMNADFLNKDKWNRMMLENIAGAGIFAADRSITEYADNIWNLKRLKG